MVSRRVPRALPWAGEWPPLRGARHGSTHGHCTPPGCRLAMRQRRNGHRRPHRPAGARPPAQGKPGPWRSPPCGAPLYAGHRSSTTPLRGARHGSTHGHCTPPGCRLAMRQRRNGHRRPHRPAGARPTSPGRSPGKRKGSPSPALKGRTRDAVDTARPFRAAMVSRRVPRASPWAGESPPLRGARPRLNSRALHPAGVPPGDAAAPQRAPSSASPRRGETHQPRAKPWEPEGESVPSPERAELVTRSNTSRPFRAAMVSRSVPRASPWAGEWPPLRGARHGSTHWQLGLDPAPSGRQTRRNSRALHPRRGAAWRCGSAATGTVVRIAPQGRDPPAQGEARAAPWAGEWPPLRGAGYGSTHGQSGLGPPPLRGARHGAPHGQCTPAGVPPGDAAAPQRAPSSASPRRGETHQPRAKPWEPEGESVPSPERAELVTRSHTSRPFRAAMVSRQCSQGVALGW